MGQQDLERLYFQIKRNSILTLAAEIHKHFQESHSYVHLEEANELADAIK